MPRYGVPSTEVDYQTILLKINQNKLHIRIGKRQTHTLTLSHSLTHTHTNCRKIPLTSSVTRQVRYLRWSPMTNTLLR